MATWGNVVRPRGEFVAGKYSEEKQAAVRAYRALWAEEVRRIRVRLGISQQSLADRVGRTRSVVAAWEGGASAPLAKDRLALAQLLREQLISEWAPGAGVDWPELATSPSCL